MSPYCTSCLQCFFFFFTEGQTPPLAVWLLKAHYDSITCPSLQQAHSRAKRAPFSCQGEGRRNEQQLWIETRRGSVVSGGERLSNCGLVKNLGQDGFRLSFFLNRRWSVMEKLGRSESWPRTLYHTKGPEFDAPTLRLEPAV